MDVAAIRVEASSLVKFMVQMKSTGEFNAAASKRLYDAIRAMVDFQKTVVDVRPLTRAPRPCAPPRAPQLFPARYSNIRAVALCGSAPLPASA